MVPTLIAPTIQEGAHSSSKVAGGRCSSVSARFICSIGEHSTDQCQCGSAVPGFLLLAAVKFVHQASCIAARLTSTYDLITSPAKNRQNRRRSSPLTSSARHGVTQ